MEYAIFKELVIFFLLKSIDVCVLSRLYMLYNTKICYLKLKFSVSFLTSVTLPLRT